MKRGLIKTETSLEVNESYEGQRLEDQVERLLNNNEPLPADAPLIWSDRKDGVEPSYDINSDRHELVMEAMSVVEKTTKAKRLARQAGEVKDQSADGTQETK